MSFVNRRGHTQLATEGSWWLVGEELVVDDGSSVFGLIGCFAEGSCLGLRDEKDGVVWCGVPD